MIDTPFKTTSQSLFKNTYNNNNNDSYCYASFGLKILDVTTNKESCSWQDTEPFLLESDESDWVSFSVKTECRNCPSTKFVLFSDTKDDFHEYNTINHCNTMPKL